MPSSFRHRAGAGALASLLLSPLLCLPAHAQAPADEDALRDRRTSLTIGDIVVTGAKNESGATPVTSVDVLAGSIAQRENVDAAFQLFSRLPGVLTSNFGQGPSNDGSISLRGFNSEGSINAVKLLIDGIPSNTNDGFTWMLDAVQPMDIDRIEVVRGTSDARYGIHNIAGNVNITTRQEGSFLDAKASAGSLGTRDGQIAAGLESGSFSQYYFAGYRRSNGFRAHAQGERLSLAGKWFYAPGAIRLGATARYYHGSGQEPGFLTQADAQDRPRTSYALSASDGGRRTIQQYGLHLDGEVADGLAASAKLYLVDYDDVRFVRFSESFSQQERGTRQRQYGGIAHVDWTPDTDSLLHAFSIEAGGDFQIQRNRYDRYLTEARVRTAHPIAQDFDLSIYGAYVQAVIEPTDWLRITPAWRIDRVEGNFEDRRTGARYSANDYGTISQPKVSAAITPVKGVTAYGNYGRTFQIGLGSSTYLIPPQVANLRPSYNDGWETGVKFSHGDWFEGRVAAWKQVATGEVQYDELRAVYTNIGGTRRVGFDVQANLRPASWISLWAAWSKQRGRIVTPNPATPEQAGNRIDHVPDHILSGGIDLRPSDRLRLTLLGNGQTDYELDTSNLHGRFGGYAVFNVEVAYKVTPRVELTGQVRNLANERYAYVWWDGEQTLHAPADGRAVYGSIRLTI